MSSTQPRGRPGTKLADRMRVALWSAAVLDVSGLKDAKSFEQQLARKHNIRITSGLWARYLRGDVLPQGALNGAKTSLPKRLDRIYPRTYAVFNDPLWGLLSWEGMADLNALRKIYLNLDDEVSVHFVMKVDVGGERIYPNDASFWHLEKTMEERRRVMQSFPLRTRVVVGLLEARMAYAAQRIDVFVDCQSEACSALQELQRLASDRGSKVQVHLLLRVVGCPPAVAWQ